MKERAPEIVKEVQSDLLLRSVAPTRHMWLQSIMSFFQIPTGVDAPVSCPVSMSPG